MFTVRKCCNSTQLCQVTVCFSKFSTNVLKASQYTEERMSAWQAKDYGCLADIHLASIRVPPIVKPQEIIVKVHAASINPLDTAVIGGYGKKVLNVMRIIDKAQNGLHNINQQQFQPLSVGRDFSGEVFAIGHNVKNIIVGDYVCGTVSPQKQGSHTEYLLTNESNVCRISPVISNIQAASFPYVGLTGWSALVVSGHMKPCHSEGKKVIVLGASGGIGSIATQILKAWGAKVVGVCSPDSFEMVRSCGAADVFDYKDPDTMKLLTSKPCFDLVLDASGKTDLRWLNSLKKWTGASYVSLTSPLLRYADEKGILAGFSKTLCEAVGHNLISLKEGRAFKWAFYMPNQHALRELVRMVENGKIKPWIDKVYPFKDAIEAYRHVMEGPSRGKTVINFLEK